MILISSHLDRVIQDFNLDYRMGNHIGLLDNFIGVLVTYLTLYDDQNLAILADRGRIGIWHNQGEEWGNLEDHPVLGPKDIVLVVDVAAGEYYSEVDFVLENISGFTDKQIRELREGLKWQGFNIKARKFTGRDDEDDESWEWKKLGVRTLSFIIPIESKNDGWHRVQQDSMISYKKVKTARQGLKRVVSSLLYLT